MGPVGPTLCCPANGIRLGVCFLDGGTHLGNDGPKYVEHF
jgi:hypothetical protein